MYQNKIYTTAICFAMLMAAACSNSKTSDNAASADSTATKTDSSGQMTESPVPEAQPVENNKVECKESEKENTELMTTESTKTCTWRNFKSVANGAGDMQGRMSYSYILYKKSGENFSKIKNADLFNDKKQELLNLVNEKIKADYKKFSADPESSSCFEGVRLRPFSLKDLGITFSDTGMEFHASFGLDESCMAVDGTIVTIPYPEISNYLNP